MKMNKLNLSDQIKKLRSSKKYTLAVMAERLGVTTSAVAAYENGSRKPSLDVLVKMARMFGVTVDNLLGYSNKDCIDVSGLCAAQRDNVHELISTYRKFNTLIYEMFETEEERAILAAEEYFGGSVDFLEKAIEGKKGKTKFNNPNTDKKTYDNIQDNKDGKVSENGESEYSKDKNKKDDMQP